MDHLPYTIGLRQIKSKMLKTNEAIRDTNP
jgi:hypothetical protein